MGDLARWLRTSAVARRDENARSASPCRFGVVCRCVDQTSGCAQNPPLWHVPVTAAISSKNVPNGALGTGPGRIAGRCSVAFVAVNAEQAEDGHGASGREFIEQRERHSGCGAG